MDKLRKMSKHIEVNGKLVQANKRYSDLKQRQKSQISQWLYDTYTKQVAENILDEEALALVFVKMDEAQIWIPECEIKMFIVLKRRSLKSAWKQQSCMIISSLIIMRLSTTGLIKANILRRCQGSRYLRES